MEPRKNWKLLMLIDEKGITQRELATLVGIHESLISNICTGYRIPTGEQKKKIAKALNVSVKRIFE